MATFLHIGLPRTGTTWWQRMIFPYLQGIQYAGMPHTYYSHAVQEMLFADDSWYNAGGVGKQLSHLQHGSWLISDENLCGQAHYLQYTNRTRTAHRLAEVFPDATIMLFLRGQISLLQSQFALAVEAGHTLKAEDFLALNPQDVDWDGPVSERTRYARYTFHQPAEALPAYRYSQLIALYASLFPRLEVFLFEDFVGNPAAMVNRILSLTGTQLSDKHLNTALSTRANSSLNADQLSIAQTIGQLPVPALLKTKAVAQVRSMYHKGKPYRFSEAISQQLRAYYQYDNQFIAETLPGIGIQRYPDAYPH